MATGTINIRLKTGFDGRGVADAGRSIEDFRQKMIAAGRSIHAVNSELSQKIHNVAESIAVDLARAADKGVVAKHALSAKEIEKAWRDAWNKQVKHAENGANRLKSIADGIVNGIGGRFKQLATEFVRGGIWGGAANLVVKAFSWAWDKIQEGAELAAKRAERAFKDSITSIKDAAAGIDKEFNSATAAIDKTISRFDAMIDSVKDLTKAEIELAKQRAIAEGADSDVAKAAAADLEAEIDYNVEEEKIKHLIAEEQKRIDTAKKAEQASAEEVKKATDKKIQAEKDLEKKREEYIKKHAIKEGDNVVVGDIGAVYATAENARISREEKAREFDESDEAEKLREAVKTADEAIKGIDTGEKAKATIADATAKIQDAQTRLDALELKREARELSVVNELVEKEEKAAEKAAEAEEKAAEKKAQAEEKAAEKAERAAAKAERDAEKRAAAEEKAAEKLAREREKQEIKLHNQRMANLRTEIAEQTKAAAQQRSVAAAAQSEFDKAFAMYRDSARAEAEIGEEQAYRNDLERLHKDARRYGGKWRIDELSSLMAAGDTQGVSDTLAGWRKSRGFTPQVEAMVRASAAENAKTTVEDELRKIETNTKDLSSKLEELLSSKGRS